MGYLEPLVIIIFIFIFGVLFVTLHANWGLMKIHSKADFTVTAREMVKNDRNCREIPSKHREYGVKTNHVTVKLITPYLCRETKITAWKNSRGETSSCREIDCHAMHIS